MVSGNGDEIKSLSANESYHHKQIKDEKKNNKQRKSYAPDDNNEDLLKLFTDASKKLVKQVKRIFYFILMDLGGKQVIDRIAQWFVQHPHLAICLLALALVASLPVLMFLAFALSTLVLTFMGFLVLEGTLLTVITMITFGLLAALGIFLIFCAFVGLATYFGVSRAYEVYDSTATERKKLINPDLPNADVSENNNPRENVSDNH